MNIRRYEKKDLDAVLHRGVGLKIKPAEMVEKVCFCANYVYFKRKTTLKSVVFVILN